MIRSALTRSALIVAAALLGACGAWRSPTPATAASAAAAPPAAPATRVAAPARPLPSLAGTRWSPIAGASIGDGRMPHLQLLADGQAIGSGGCNRFNGKWQSEGNALRIGPLGATRMACPEAQMRSELEFFKALEATRSGRSEAGRLVLLDASGALLLALEPVQ